MRMITNGLTGCDNQYASHFTFGDLDLGTESTGLRMYLDPMEQGRTGRLKFKTNATYAVVPAEVYSISPGTMRFHTLCYTSWFLWLLGRLVQVIDSLDNGISTIITTAQKVLALGLAVIPHE